VPAHDAPVFFTFLHCPEACTALAYMGKTNFSLVEDKCNCNIKITLIPNFYTLQHYRMGGSSWLIGILVAQRHPYHAVEKATDCYNHSST